MPKTSGITDLEDVEVSTSIVEKAGHRYKITVRRDKYPVSDSFLSGWQLNVLSMHIRNGMDKFVAYFKNEENYKDYEKYYFEKYGKYPRGGIKPDGYRRKTSRRT